MERKKLVKTIENQYPELEPISRGSITWWVSEHASYYLGIVHHEWALNGVFSENKGLSKEEAAALSEANAHFTQTLNHAATSAIDFGTIPRPGDYLLEKWDAEADDYGWVVESVFYGTHKKKLLIILQITDD